MKWYQIWNNNLNITVSNWDESVSVNNTSSIRVIHSGAPSSVQLLQSKPKFRMYVHLIEDLNTFFSAIENYEFCYNFTKTFNLLKNCMKSPHLGIFHESWIIQILRDIFCNLARGDSLPLRACKIDISITVWPIIMKIREKVGNWQLFKTYDKHSAICHVVALESPPNHKKR